MSVLNRVDPKIVPAKSHNERTAHQRKMNVRTLARDIKANGSGFIRSKRVVDEVIEMDGRVSYSYNKEDGLFHMSYEYPDNG